jgi:hypothetical protein
MKALSCNYTPYRSACQAFSKKFLSIALKQLTSACDQPKISSGEQATIRAARMPKAEN